MNIRTAFFGSVAAVSMMAAASVVSAGVIDFTAASTGTSGTVDGVAWTMTGKPVQGNNKQAFDGSMIPANSFGLAFNTDGYGVRDDEIGPRESITITFAKAVRITGFAFLDLYESIMNPGTGEVGEITINGMVYDTAFTGNASGYSESIFGKPVLVTSVKFTSVSSNDDRGVLDGALAALAIAPIPVPAAGLMLLTALGGVAALRRRKA